MIAAQVVLIVVNFASRSLAELLRAKHVVLVVVLALFYICFPSRGKEFLSPIRSNDRLRRTICAQVVAIVVIILREARHIPSRDHLAAENDQSLHYVSQLAYVSWPVALL